MFYLFLALYLIAATMYLVGTFGLLGAERDPLSGVFLIPLGLPWNLWIDAFAEPAWPWLAALAPLANLAILSLVMRRFRHEQAARDHRLR